MRINNVIRHKGIKNTSFLVCLSFAWLCLAHSQSFIFPSFAKAQSDAGIIRNICKECDKLNAGTCLSCGCYVEIRAAMKQSKCPNRKWA